MAKSKKTEVIVGVPSEEYWVEKSRPLMLMKEVPFELGELKVLDTYLARINPKNPNATTVRFSKEEYEDLMGIERMRPERLDKYIRSIMSKTVKIPDTTARGGFRVYTLFDEAICEPDENGQWWIDLSCTRKAKKLFFEIDRIGYLKYQLKNVLPLTSKYSVLLYLYLLDNRFRRSWEISVSELREKVFRCMSEYYAEHYKDFRRDILEKALKEVNEKTDITFSYSPIKTGVRVTTIRWNLVKDNSAPPALPEPVPLDELDDEDDFDDEDTDFSDNVKMWAVYLPSELSLEEVEILGNMAYKHVPYDRDNILPRANRVADYLSEKHMVLKKYEKKKGREIKKYAFLKKAVEEDWKP